MSAPDPQPRPQDQEAAAEFQAALEARRQGDWQRSLGHLQRAIALAPGDANHHANAGGTLFMLGRHGEAAAAYERALALDPRHLNSLNNLAVIYSLGRKCKEAEELLLRSVAIDPNQPEAWLNLCSAVEKLDFREDDVVTYARRAVALRPDDARPYQYLGKGLLRQGDPVAALEAMRQAARLAPGDAAAHYGVGICCMELGLVAETVDAFQQALAADANHGQTYYALAEFLLRLEELPAAEEAARHARETLDDKIAPEYLLARILFAQGRHDEAKAVYDNYRALYHKHQSQVTGKRPPGGKAVLLPVESVDAWCGRKGLVPRELLPALACPTAPLIRFGNLPAEPEFAPGIVPRAHVAELRRVVILPGHEVILADNERIALYDRLAGLQDRNNLMEDEVVRLAGSDRVLVDMGPEADKPIREGIFLLGQFWYNYAHWLLEHLPRLWTIEQCPEYRGLPLLINEKLYPQQMESLRLLNRDRHPLTVLPLGKRFRVERLVFPASLTASMVMRYRQGTAASPMDVTLHPEAVTFLRERLLPECPPADGRRRRLWVSRKTKIQAGHRRLINEAEVEALFLDKGFEVVIPETLSFREQVTTFAAAEMIAGCAGAGMINSLFAPADARILMFTKNHPQVNFHYFTNIARCIGQPIAYVCGESLQNFGLHGFEADFTVDLGVARKAQADFLGI
jgi:capsular polysaccharide biosynthesis protein/Flp pilus assembly protein TadD